MNWLSVIRTGTFSIDHKYLLYLFSCIVYLSMPLANANETDSAWATTLTPQAYWQSYDGTITRDNSYSAGAYVMADYLESSAIGAGYTFTLVNLNNNARIMEHQFYATGRHHWFLDSLPGKLSLRLDIYGGNSTLDYRTSNPPTGMKKNPMAAGSSREQETTTITVIQPIVSFINFRKTLYVDLGYAKSNYNENPDAAVTQLTPTAGFGWNNSYDWLQLRAYAIKLDENNGVYNDNRYRSTELSYTHWFATDETSRLDFIRISALGGERVLAVDPDAAVVHSTGDKQTGNWTASAQWKLSETSRLLFLWNHNNYENDVSAEKYTGQLLYLNVQHRW